MYKELIIVLFIIISIFTLDFFMQKYTDEVINDSIQDLYKLEESIKKNEEEIDNEQVTKDANEKYEKWMKYHKKLAFFIEHNELESVETNFVAGKSFVERAKYEDAFSEIEKTIFVLKHINDKYSINLENIF